MATASILDSVRKKIGPLEDYDAFDEDLIDHINSVITYLNQLGVGPEEGFEITGSDETWSDYLGDNEKLLNAVKSYMFFKVRMMFDPPQSSIVAEAMNKAIDEAEWRVTVMVDTINGGTA